MSTLLRDSSSMLAVMFSGRFPLVKGEDDAYFIDRDPTYFRYILNHLRNDGSAVVPETDEGREDLLKEAYYYQLTGLVTLLTGIIIFSTLKLSIFYCFFSKLLIIIKGRGVREKDLGEENLKMRDEENRVRNLFIKDPNCSEVQDPYCHLVNVFKESKTFHFATAGSINFLWNFLRFFQTWISLRCWIKKEF